MKTRTAGTCEFCGKSLVGMDYEETTTKEKREVCSYACLQGIYLDEIPEDEDFLNAKT